MTTTTALFQERQIDFLRSLESKEELGWKYSYDVSCKDCNDGFICHAACTGIDFLKKHRGHKTWVKYLGKQNPLR